MWKYKEYPRLVVFEMHVLPEYAFALDLLSNSIFSPEISDECSEWFWRFPICVGMPNISSSEDVIKYSVEAVKALENPCLEVYNLLKQSIPDADSKEILESWRESLGIMIVIADNREECKWFAPLYPIDKAFTKNPIHVSGKTAENLERLFSNVSNTD